MFRNHFPHYFKTKLPTQIEELYLTSALMDFAGSAIALFEPIWLWTLGFDIQHVMFFYVLVYVPYFILLPLGGKICGPVWPGKINCRFHWLADSLFCRVGNDPRLSRVVLLRAAIFCGPENILLAGLSL